MHLDVHALMTLDRGFMPVLDGTILTTHLIRLTLA